MVPEVLVESGGRVRLRCCIADEIVGEITCTEAEPIEFRGRLPATTDEALHLNFEVENGLTAGKGDLRDLGIIVPVIARSKENPEGVPFRVS